MTYTTTLGVFGVDGTLRNDERGTGDPSSSRTGGPWSPSQWRLGGSTSYLEWSFSVLGRVPSGGRDVGEGPEFRVSGSSPFGLRAPEGRTGLGG